MVRANFCGHLLGFLLIVLGVSSARGSVVDDVHILLAREEFSAADARAQNELNATPGADGASLIRQLDALDLMIDSVIVQRRFIDDTTEDLNQRAIDLTRTLYGETSRRMAKRWMVEYLREGQLSKMPGGDAKVHLARAIIWIKQGVDRLQEGGDRVAAVDEARVYLAAIISAQDRGRDDEALAFCHQAEIRLHQPRDLWEQRWRVPVLSEIGATQEKQGSVTLGLASSRAAQELALQVAGPRSLLRGDALTLLGQFEYYQGDSAAAADNLQQAIEIFRAHSSVISSAIEIPLYVLANVQMGLGDYDRARPLFEEALALAHDAAGHFSVNYPAYLNSFAMLEQHVGNIDRARSLLQQSVAMIGQVRGESSPVLLPVLCNFADLELTQGNTAAAEQLYQRAAEILKVNGNVGYWRYMVDFGLAGLALSKGRPEQAESLLAEAIAQRKGAFGERHPDMLELHCSHALALARLGRSEAAFTEAEAIETYRLSLMQRLVPGLDETSAIHFKEVEHKNCSGLLLAIAEQDHDSTQATRAWELVARARGLITNFRSLRLAAARNAATPREKALWSTWQAAVHAYAKVLLNATADANDLKTVENVLEKAENDLGASTLAAAGLVGRTAPLTSLLASRPGEDAVVAYVREDGFDISPTASNSRSRGQVLHALVSRGTVRRLVTLGDAVEVDETIARWYTLLRQPQSGSAALQAAGVAVREKIWDPLAITGAASRVFTVPDGAIFRVNFAALPDTGGFLVERGWRFHVLEREDDLAITTTTAETTPPDRILLLGNPDFGNYAADSASRAGVCGSGMNPLPGSALEIDRLAQLWRETHAVAPSVLEGAKATKNAMEQALASVQMLHFATHTLALGERCSDATGNRSVRLTTTLDDSRRLDGEAALALAGANSYLQQQDSVGILTSQEVLALALDNIRWIVLSACDTGLGDVVNGEGVFGLRRAFRMAGAHTVIMSLWKVNDGATAEWMESLYRLRLKAHLETPEALAQADLAVLAARRARGESTHPFYWAGFVAAGDWR